MDMESLVRLSKEHNRNRKCVRIRVCATLLCCARRALHKKSIRWAMCEQMRRAFGVTSLNRMMSIGATAAKVEAMDSGREVMMADNTFAEARRTFQDTSSSSE